ncbi:MAG: phage head closure protein [Planctomycetaceae bacterium]
MTIQDRSTTRDSVSGQVVEDWTDGDTVWAAVQPLSGKELEHAQAIKAQINTKIVIRYHAGVTPASRIKFNGRLFHVVSVINTDELNTELVCFCEEVV